MYSGAEPEKQLGGLAHGLGSNPTFLGQKPPKGESQDKWKDGKKAEAMGTEGKRDFRCQRR